MGYSEPPAKTTGAPIGAAGWNTYIRDNMIFLKDQGATKHGCTLRRSSATSVPHVTTTKVSYNIEIEDTDNFHSTITNPERATIPTGLSGIYALTFVVRFGAATSWAQVVQVNDLAVARNYGTFILNQSSTITWVGFCTAGDYITSAIWQASGSSQNDSPSSAPNDLDGYMPLFTVYKIG